jgi:subtilase family serine protease
MTRKPSVFLLTIFAMVAGGSVVSQAAQPQSLLTRHVRSVILDGQAHSVGRLPARQSLQLDVVLPIRDQAGLDSLFQELYDPSSPFYRNFITVPEFTARYAPTQEDYDAVVRFAKANGFTVVGGSRDSLDVQMKGSVAAIESAFHVTMGVYQHPTENRTFYSPDREPTVNLPFQLWHISGLDNYSIPRTALQHRSAGAHSLATTGSCPEQSFCGSDMRAAYYEGTALTGAGQDIGLLEYAGFDIADVNTYYENAGQTRTAAVTGISTDGTPINCFADQGCDDTEQTIDITQSLGMAPGITTNYIYVGSSDTALLGAMSSDTPLPLNLSSSWYWDPPDPNTDDPFFEKMASQGQSFFEAAGDSGAWRATNTWWPMESAYVICVGGTDLNTQSAGGPWASETVWVDGGGGISPDKIAIPTWQQLPGVITTTNKGSTVYRNGPDVSANSNFTFYVCADQTTCTANYYGGTSFAAPMWAGYLALTNEQAATNGDAPPGFINPTIYPLALGSGYASDFHDIVSGSNGFSAEPGYDLASGWGSPNTNGLINALAPVPSGSFTLSASPKLITVAQGASGTSTITSTITGGFNSAVTLSTKYKTEVAFSPNPIPAPGSGTSTMTVSVGANAALGYHTIVIAGAGGSVSATATVTVDVVK